ncbi:transposase [Belliella baltica DSM 15883]|uniref:Transposase n=5 Tax=Cyclobacteriaceae TaxID=563798 RepID=I3Z7V1_BELBD|nr:transposase [Belliella baltica DSM 15883]
MSDHREEFAVEKMCQVFGVSRSSFYDWLNRKPSKRALENDVLRQTIQEVTAQTKSRLGSPKLTLELEGRGIFISRPRVARLMKLMGIRSVISKKFKVCTTESDHPYAPSKNVLDRDFTATRPGEKWVSDITYVRTQQGWLYLTIVMDLFDRKIIGWSMSRTLEANPTVVAALQMALRNRPVNPNELIFHSDRGVQYACEEFRSLLQNHRIIQSMSRKGNCWDNAVAENFFKIIKSELIYQLPLLNIGQTQIEIFEFIEIWYNKKRKHSYLNYLTPEQFGEKTKTKAA